MKSSTENFSSALRFRTRKRILSSIEIITATRVVQTSDPEPQVAARGSRPRATLASTLHQILSGEGPHFARASPVRGRTCPARIHSRLALGCVRTPSVVLARTMSPLWFEFSWFEWTGPRAGSTPDILSSAARSRSGRGDKISDVSSGDMIGARLHTSLGLACPLAAPHLYFLLP